jgi:CdiI immunity protein
VKLRRRRWGRSWEELEREFPNLLAVLGSYLHQDWDLDFATSKDALSAAREGSPKDRIEGAVLEIDDLLSRDLDDYTLSEIVVDLCGGGGPETHKTSEWLADARQILSSERAA